MSNYEIYLQDMIRKNSKWAEEERGKNIFDYYLYRGREEAYREALYQFQRMEEEGVLNPSSE